MHKIKGAMRHLLKQTIFLFLDIFFFLFKRDNQIAICRGWKGIRFADNSRYMFTYLSANKETSGLKKTVWLTQNEALLQELKSKGYETCKEKSVRGYWLYPVSYTHLRAHETHE